MAPADPEPDVEPQPDPVRAKQTKNGLYWVCAGVSLVVGAFQYSHTLGSVDGFDVRAVVGLLVMTLCLLGLAVVYALCALGRTELRRRVFDRFDLFQVSTVLLVAAVLVGVLIPPRTTTALGLLLPWGIGYWLYHLAAQQAAERSEEE
ncbi:hypothetical protein OG474_15745 [Kribbella sp. NBC_01505]|uniref:hypothetical protein n=1 Tax=Kribbella sp. NBC_01505 TaxID=2903580 RepID=UPI00386573B7